ncbi:hypothetical protein OKW31_006845 [Paraburkholderia atlantica]|uniref:DUF2971 domain-containing protein n=1 Tax=Paraburkholderia atlantica TaxID=2654982 RepID=UPI003D24FB22
MSLGVKHRRDLHRDMLDRERAQLRTQRAYDKNANEYGIYSMAETPRSLLMWAHYAESHTGVCLGFYVPARSRRVCSCLTGLLQRLISDD